MSTERIDAVPMLDLKRQFNVIGAQMNEALRRVNESGQFILGPEVKKLEENVANYSRTNYAVGCASGSDALLLSLMAANVGKGDAARWRDADLRRYRSRLLQFRSSKSR